VDDRQTTTLPSGTEFQRWVRMSRRLNAPAERVFRAWADPAELARWLPEHVDGGLAVGSRSTLVWPDQRVWWDVLEARPPSTFVFRRPWLPDERFVTRVNVNIESVGYGSRVQLEDGPFPLDQPLAIDAWAMALEHWTEALAMLRAHLDFSVDLRNRG
jgi:uncharacterized protein YndB with AHSA1/START domain